MQNPPAELVHEATSLFRLVESIDRFVSEHEFLFAYSEANRAFFAHVHRRAEDTRGLISTLLAKSDSRAAQHRMALVTQKERWKIIHTYVKPATDAHTLNIPAPLIRLATEYLLKATGATKTKVVALLTPELMYFHNTPESSLAADLVFVELPYSQGPGFFTNLTIYHEIGHWVYDLLKSDAQPRAAFDRLTSAMERAFEVPGANIQTPSTKVWARNVIESWTQEIFCDLYACGISARRFRLP